MRARYGMFFVSWNSGFFLLHSLQCCMEYYNILDCVKTAPNCITSKQPKALIFHQPEKNIQISMTIIFYCYHQMQYLLVHICVTWMQHICMFSDFPFYAYQLNMNTICICGFSFYLLWFWSHSGRSIVSWTYWFCDYLLYQCPIIFLHVRFQSNWIHWVGGWSDFIWYIQNLIWHSFVLMKF